MLSRFTYYCAERHYAECRYAVCRYAECHNAMRKAGYLKGRAFNSKFDRIGIMIGKWLSHI